jgi:hypothetical protein
VFNEPTDQQLEVPPALSQRQRFTCQWTNDNCDAVQFTQSEATAEVTTHKPKLFTLKSFNMHRKWTHKRNLTASAGAPFHKDWSICHPGQSNTAEEWVLVGGDIKSDGLRKWMIRKELFVSMLQQDDESCCPCDWTASVTNDRTW